MSSNGHADGELEDCVGCRVAAQVIAIDPEEYREFVAILELHGLSRSDGINVLSKLIAGKGN